MNALLALALITATIAGQVGIVHPQGQDVWVDLDTPARMVIEYTTSRGEFSVDFGPQEPGWYTFPDWSEVDLSIERIILTADQDLSMRAGLLHTTYVTHLEGS